MPSLTMHLSPTDQARIENGKAVISLLNGEISAASLHARCRERISEKDASIGAFLHCAEFPAVGGRAAGGPLRGLPFAVKDLDDTCQFGTSYGSAAYESHRPLADAALVALLRHKGATVLGKTVTTEFAFSHPGPTRNPHNLEHTPGGSSSGSAAAVAGGMAPFAIGTQTAGSIIRPASFCGIAGFKPSFGLWPTAGIKSFSWSLDTVGFFAPTHAAMRAVLEKLAFQQAQPRSAGKPRIAIVQTPMWPQASPGMREAVTAAGGLARDSGWPVREIALDDTVWAGFSAQLTIQAYEAARTLSGEFETVPHLLSPALVAEISRGLAISDAEYAAALEAARAARRGAARLFEQHDALLTPSSAGAAPRGLQSTGSPDFNRLWTLLGLPCANVPGFADGTGLPLGVQLVGPFMGDDAILQIAARVENMIAGHVSSREGSAPVE